MTIRWLLLLTFLVLTPVACAPKAPPLRGAIVPVRLPGATLPPLHRKLVFLWEYTDESVRARCEATLALGTVSETIQVSGIRCERCVGRLAGALRGHDGLEYANANLMGQVQLQWDDERTNRDAILAALSRAGFRELEAV